MGETRIKGKKNEKEKQKKKEKRRNGKKKRPPLGKAQISNKMDASIKFIAMIFTVLFLLVSLSCPPKKVELLIRFFEPFGRSRVSHFLLRTFAKVEHHPAPLGASDKTDTQSRIDIFGSNETMQNALASIV